MKLVVALALLSNAAAFMAPVQPRAPATPLKAITTEAMIEKAKADRLAHLEAQSLEALTLAADNFERAVFPNAMIVGDCVITHLLGKLGYLESGKVKVMVVDTFHLFDSTMPFLDSLERSTTSRPRSSVLPTARTRTSTSRSTATSSGSPT